MPEIPDKPSLLAAVSRLRRYGSEKSYVVWDTDDTSEGWAQAYRRRDADRADIASALLARVTASEGRLRDENERLRAVLAIARDYVQDRIEAMEHVLKNIPGYAEFDANMESSLKIHRDNVAVIDAALAAKGDADAGHN